MLASQLPRESRVKAALSGDDEGRRWSEQTYLTATLVELLQLTRNEQLARMLGKQARSKVPKFRPVSRPGAALDDEVDEPTSKADPDRYEAIQTYLATMAPPPPPAATSN